MFSPTSTHATTLMDHGSTFLNKLATKNNRNNNKTAGGATTTNVSNTITMNRTNN